MTTPASGNGHLAGALAWMSRVGVWNDDTLADVVAKHAKDRPGATAVIDRLGKRKVTYADLDRDAARVAGFLVAQGGEPGDVVAMQLPNWYKNVVVALGIFKAVGVPAAPRSRRAIASAAARRRGRALGIFRTARSHRGRGSHVRTRARHLLSRTT